MTDCWKFKEKAIKTISQFQKTINFISNFKLLKRKKNDKSAMEQRSANRIRTQRREKPWTRRFALQAGNHRHRHHHHHHYHSFSTTNHRQSAMIACGIQSKSAQWNEIIINEMLLLRGRTITSHTHIMITRTLPPTFLHLKIK